MTRGARHARAAGLGAAGWFTGSLILAEPAGAHGVAGASDLPLPAWQMAWGAGAAVLVSFALLAAAWPRPRLATIARGRRLPPGVQGGLAVATGFGRAVAVALLVLVVVAGLFGSSDAAANLAPVAVYVGFWVGVPLLCALVGDVWAAVNPLDTLLRLAAPARRRPAVPLGPRGERLAAPARAEGGPPVVAADTVAAGADPPVWLAALGLGAFAWLELAYHDPFSPRLLGAALAGYVVVLVGLAARQPHGPAWLARADGFAVLFGLLGRLGPLARGDDGAWRLRPPISGLAAAPADRRTLGVIVVVLGSIIFDGVSQLGWWSRTLVGDRVGWERTVVDTLGLTWTIAAVGLTWLAASRLAGRVTAEPTDHLARRFAPSLVPIALAYLVAHALPLLVFEGQNLVVQLSDPLGRGWDLLGTGDWRIDYTVVGTATIVRVQALAIVAGHVAGVVVAHDRAVERYPPTVALPVRYPYLAVMVGTAVIGVLLLLGA